MLNWKIALLLGLCLCLLGGGLRADTRVFRLQTATPASVVEALRSLYGEQIRAEVIQQQLVVVADAERLAEIDRLLEQMDRPPLALRLTLSEDPPEEQANVVSYSAGRPTAHVIETVEKAPVMLEYSEFSQRPVADGWWVAIEDVPTRIEALTLQVQRQGAETLVVTVGFERQRDGERKVFGATVSGRFDDWLPLLPQPVRSDATYQTAPKRGSQLYLKVERAGPP